MADSAKGDVHVELVDVSKNFGGVQAVRNVSLEVMRGTVHGLVGENGAGKSTAGKIIAGALQASGGFLRVNGEEVSFNSPRDALAQGIAIIDQELALVQPRSVIDNIFLGTESRRGFLANPADQKVRFDALMERTGFALQADTIVGSLRVAEQQKIEIVRAIARDAEFIIMDEPTARLTAQESEQLYGIIDGLRKGGTTIMFVSHFLDEVLAISDNVTVMRDGLHVRTGPSKSETTQSLVTAMLGRDLDLTFPERRLSDSSSQPVLEVTGLSGEAGFEDVDLTLRPGEIVGMAGLIGAGRSEFARGIFGSTSVSAGEIKLDGEVVDIRSPRSAIAQGLALVTESRKDDGLIMTRSISENAILPFLHQVSTMGVVRQGAERARTTEMMKRLDIRAPNAQSVIRNLSGGNQQKVLFAKSLMETPKVLIIDEPTRGVDVGAKQAIYELITDLAASGMAILLISSELEEIMGLSHRIVVMRRGRIVAELDAETATEETVLASAFGTVTTTSA